MTKPISWYLLGGLSLLAGITALLNPLAATLAVETLTGISFLAIGVLQLLLTFREKGWKSRTWSLAVGLSFSALGLLLLANPIAGIASLTILTAMALFAVGIAKILLARTFETHQSFLAVLISGCLSLGLAVLIFLGLPGTLAVTLGLFFAVELISNGISLIVLGRYISTQSK